MHVRSRLDHLGFLYYTTVYCYSIYFVANSMVLCDSTGSWNPLVTIINRETLRESVALSNSVKARVGLSSSKRVMTLALRSRPTRWNDMHVSNRVTSFNQAPSVAHGVSRSFRAHHINATLGLDFDGLQ